MSTKNLLEAIEIGGFRSFGTLQHFDSFSKINLLIGQNNVGKSNFFKFLKNVYPKTGRENNALLENGDRHIPVAKNFRYGFVVNKQLLTKQLIAKFKVKDVNSESSLEKLITQINKDKPVIWFYLDEGSNLEKNEGVLNAFDSLQDNELQGLWIQLTSFSGGGGRDSNWIPDVIKHFNSRPIVHKVEFIPAIREVNSKSTNREQFSGERLIDDLAKLQNPSSHEQHLREKFENINKFLQEVTTNLSAKIEIPYERDTINVSMNNRVLPLASLGSGIQEIIIIAAAATTIENSIVCVEEPELHLNPILQKRLVRYLEKNTNNQYFISTHSASLMDTPNAEIYHIRLENDESIVERVTSDKSKTEVCADLGYHPSDLLQSNCVIWVEGPSDRIYLNYWIKAIDSNLIEGVHYSIMFYGGKLLSHLTAEHDVILKEFISLRSLNRHAVILIDSDKSALRKLINSTKKRIVEEFQKGPGFAWVTKGREVENYIPEKQLTEAIKEVHPKAELLSDFGQFDNNLKIKLNKAEPEQALKVNVAKKITQNNVLKSEKDITNILDLKERLKELVGFINFTNQNL